MLELNTGGIFHLSCAKLHFFSPFLFKIIFFPVQKSMLVQWYFLHWKEALCTANVKIYKLYRAFISVSAAGEITDSFTFLIEIRPSGCGMCLGETADLACSLVFFLCWNNALLILQNCPNFGMFSWRVLNTTLQLAVMITRNNSACCVWKPNICLLL